MSGNKSSEREGGPAEPYRIKLRSSHLFPDGDDSRDDTITIEEYHRQQEAKK